MLIFFLWHIFLGSHDKTNFMARELRTTVCRTFDAASGINELDRLEGFAAVETAAIGLEETTEERPPSGTGIYFDPVTYISAQRDEDDDADEDEDDLDFDDDDDDLDVDDIDMTDEDIDEDFDEDDDLDDDLLLDEDEEEEDEDIL